MNRKQFYRNYNQLSNRADGIAFNDDQLATNAIKLNKGNIFLQTPSVIQTNSNPSGSVSFQSGIGDCFEFEVDTTSCASPITLAILAGYFKTEKIELTETKNPLQIKNMVVSDRETMPAEYSATAFDLKDVEGEFKSYSLAKYNCDPSEFNLYSGLNASVVLDDLSSYRIDANNTISIRGTDSQFTCKNFREFIKYNPVRLNQFVIRGESLQNLNSTMKIGYCNSFQDLGSSKIKIDRFFNVNQYQDGQMTVVANQEIVLDKNKFWIWSIPAGKVFTFGIYI